MFCISHLEVRDRILIQDFMNFISWMSLLSPKSLAISAAVFLYCFNEELIKIGCLSSSLFNLPNFWMVNVTQHKTEVKDFYYHCIFEVTMKTNHKSHWKIENPYERVLIKWQYFGEKILNWQKNLHSQSIRERDLSVIQRDRSSGNCTHTARHFIAVIAKLVTNREF